MTRIQNYRRFLFSLCLKTIHWFPESPKMTVAFWRTIVKCYLTIHLLDQLFIAVELLCIDPGKPNISVEATHFDNGFSHYYYELRLTLAHNPKFFFWHEPLCLISLLIEKSKIKNTGFFMSALLGMCISQWMDFKWKKPLFSTFFLCNRDILLCCFSEFFPYSRKNGADEIWVAVFDWTCKLYGNKVMLATHLCYSGHT